jgi:hypothetical protein
MRLHTFFVLLFFFFLSIIEVSCKKDSFLTTGGELKFSTDTLNFDTVFTQAGSFTLAVKIFNPQNQKITISSIRLKNGTNSFFHLNINGIPGNIAHDIDVAANDSIYVFATVNINPDSANNPFIVEDQLIATLNNKDFSIPFYAYGQNAHYLRDSVIAQNATWLTDKPYVILHSALVDKGYTLTIPAGCRIYMHQDSRLYVQGKLLINGTQQDSVIFQGDRLDRSYFGYKGYPGEWGGIYYDSSSTGNMMNWTILKNCGNNSTGGLAFAVEVFGKPNIANQLTMNNTIIENSIGYGLISFQGNVTGQNCLISQCAAQAVAILQGGNCQFDNCDFINVNSIDQPAVVALNYFDISSTQRITGDLSAIFRNCVIYGQPNSNGVYDKNQLYIDKDAGANLVVNFENCLIENSDAITIATLTNCILNTDPGFYDFANLNFRPKSSTSKLVDNGILLSTIDLDGILHDVNGKTDIGCYEFH